MAMKKHKLEIRQARKKDLARIHRLVAKVYPGLGGYTRDQLRGQLNHFTEGHLVAVYEGEIVGYCATLRISGDKGLAPHSWAEITGGGYGSTHDPAGDWLYGYEVCVDPDFRGLRLGERLYSARRALCVEMSLKGIIFGGRMPNYAKRAKDFDSAEAYARAVSEKKLRDPVVTFQIRQGFELVGILPEYLPSDSASLGYATHMVWRNPAEAELLTDAITAPDRAPDVVRIAVVQYQQRRIKSFDDFARICSYFVDTVADNKSDFVVFPEYFAVQLLSIENQPLTPRDSMLRLAEYNDQLEELFQKLAIKYNVNIIAGSHPAKDEKGRLLNVGHVFLRDGSVYEQPKLHPTPGERYWWNIEGGDYLRAIETDSGTIGMLICYDSEFPELARHLVDQGADILFVSYSTEERQGHLRVRYSCHARAIENQIYVATAGNVGNLPRVQNMDIHYAQSAILTPCDFPFARDGIAAETTPNSEMLAFADLNLDQLRSARQYGTVQNLKDRRHDLYGVTWRGPAAPDDS